MKQVVKIPVNNLLGEKARILPPVIIEAKGTRPVGITDIMEAKGLNPIGIPVELTAVKEVKAAGIVIPGGN
ncbi:hypothetical protein CBW65_05540 [Tumebacillus avium]|uniref:Uncharacterized protein n=1 Tax=Tumebacillus avium TaxID=1903704 RepID=A0A1Y0IML8_9BACL|nr:hypothetical protein [Tumebacillus avium]ARU60603.1 hypothetical protein CBW65_05540 [Tumebacillus avium]